jgi:hypothetical protein
MRMAAQPSIVRDNKAYTQVEEITPEIARRYFEANGPNRHISDVKVDSYARDILAGRWKVNGESIKFSKAGRLLDGQHRLLAVIKSGRPVQMMVTYGLDDDTMDTIDRGRPRSIGDLLSINMHDRVKSMHAPAGASQIAAICGQLALLQSGAMQMKGRTSPTYGEAVEIFRRYESEIEWVISNVGYRIEPGNFSGGAPVLACFAFCRSIDRDKLEKLAYQFKHGEDATGRSRSMPAARALRTTVTAGPKKAAGPGGSSMSWRRELVPKTLRAIEACLRGEDVTTLKVDPEVYERIVEMKRAARR